ncbi:MAG: DUF6057 family protein [Bacteroidales bacterium]
MERTAGQHKVFIAPILIAGSLGLLTFIWFAGPARYVLIANQDQTLFLTTSAYFISALQRPGGLLEYAGSFLSQFLRFPVMGALLLSILSGSVFFLTIGWLKKIYRGWEILVAGALSAVLVVAMHNYYPHQIHHTLGFILVIGAAMLVPGHRTGRRIFLLVAIPLLYYCCGGFIWLFPLIWFPRHSLEIGKFDPEGLLWVTLYPALLLPAAYVLFPYPLRDLVLDPLPLGTNYGNPVWPLFFTAWGCLLPFLASMAARRRGGRAVRHLTLSVTALAAATVMILFSYHRKNAEFFTIESRAVHEDWAGLLRYAEQHPSTNLFGNFYTNLALMHEGRLCSELFNYPQHFGRRALCFEWDAKGEILRRGSDFFWAIGFIKEAHHWAYESMVVDGITRRNLQRLIQTELVLGHRKLAAKYIGIMDRTLFDRTLARHYRGLLSDSIALARDPDLGPKTGIHIDDDFFADGLDLEKNLKNLLSNDPSLRPPFEYLMALYLLERRVDEIVALIPVYLERSGGTLPALLDETLLVYKITNREDNRTGPGVSQATIRRFEEYSQILRQSGGHEEAAKRLYPRYGNSFWYYLNFSSI